MGKTSAATADTRQLPTGAPGALLPTELLLLVLERLPPGELALTGRLVCKDAARHFSQPEHKTAPGTALDVRLLTFDGMLRLLSSVAASGRKSNVQAAWRLLHQNFIVELQSGRRFNITTYRSRRWWDDMGSAAVKAGHPDLLSCLTDDKMPVNPTWTLIEAARHCDLASFQSTWRLLTRRWSGNGYEGGVKVWALYYAARPQSPDNQAKITWLLNEASGAGAVPATGAERIRLMIGAASGAAEFGNLPVLRWLKEAHGLDLTAATPREQPLHSSSPFRVLATAMWAEDLDVARWVVDEAGCALPGLEDQAGLEEVWRWAGERGMVAKIRWLLERGVPLHPRGALAAAQKGHLDAVRHLHEHCGVALSAELFAAAAGSGSVPLVSWLLDRGCPTSPEAYNEAAAKGKLSLVVWMSEQRGCRRCPWRGLKLTLPDPTPVEVKPEDVICFHKSLKTRGREWRRVLDGRHALAWAATMGHLGLMRFFMQEWRVAPGPDTLAAAALGGCEAALDMVLERGGDRALRGGKRGESPYVGPGVKGDRATLQYLRAKGVPWGDTVLREAVRAGVKLPVVRWMVEQGAPWDELAVTRAFRREATYGERPRRFTDSFGWLGREYKKRCEESEREEKAQGQRDGELGAGQGRGRRWGVKLSTAAWALVGVGCGYVMALLQQRRRLGKG